jgi:hypothetical protein
MTNIATTKNIQATKPNRDYVRALAALAALLAAGLLALLTLSKAAEGAPQGRTARLSSPAAGPRGRGWITPPGTSRPSR